ncbi:phosphoribosylamine--glycine ligase [Afifella marina]|uniref:Phosphoribosylamine--glycine ligase n=1 Tax=Afifella marina DSM 2698 TaxID=1120955 RepID=A0A1G5M9G8_AFIMA|nr:phosphoribosylamine--glycine ligase [Afifella marina]MBK1622778.1 phosphoribosylamine--glycine ligase [Afifella marina DSM 2698]MBK1625773.1 phosphoribosylamine--glycine ligase [Afifella marina]MBK5917596.1 phosphoribosylamine--glycine ligase [Afifella marina]RAI23525.1 phosphoribosylamine--glycine ligase [Afifella marina DSM 2698]SCZ21736.1 phosphoribosylamine--glycine ligase [Afifella marina DSM 2698]
MRVLLIGGGGREHALAGALAASPRLSKLSAAPGNAGIANVAECVPLDSSDHRAVIDFCRKEAIDLVVVGPEGPLVAGLVDRLKEAKICAFGPSAAAAQLEGSKVFTKALCAEENIPTAGYEAFSDRESALAYVEKHAMPVVVKADGLAAGKGVTIATTPAEARKAVEAIFAEDGAQVVIEEHLVGEEASFFVLCDGKTARPLTTAQDFKRAYDGDEGPNTGGMGAYSPAPVMDVATQARTMREIVEPTLAAMAKRDMPFCGVLYAGLMITADGPKLIEYNVRFGDPECQVLMMRLESDLLALLDAAVAGRLDRTSLAWRKEPALTVVMAAKGYPGVYEKGSTIRGLEEAAAVEGATVFHAGTRHVDGEIVAAGGRVLNVGAIGADLSQARKRAYEAVGRIDWPEGFCRSDIGEAASRRG